jgi:hypothetical protein
VIILDRLVIGGLRFIFDQIAATVDQEMDDEGMLREELLTAQMRLELGEIDDSEFAEIEAEILPLLREIRERRQADLAGDEGGSGGRVVGVEVSFGGDGNGNRRGGS